MDLCSLLQLIPFTSNSISGYRAELAKANFSLDLNLTLELTEMNFI